MLTDDKIMEIFVMADEFSRFLTRCSAAEDLKSHEKTGSANITVTAVCPRPKSYSS